MGKYIGLDVGSTTAKIVWLANGEVKGYKITSSANWSALLKGVRKDAKIYSTGYFRRKVPHTKSVTEITAAQFGAKYYFDSFDTILDIGGQDTKVIDVRTNKFILNDKCSAGTGAFLELAAKYFDIDVRHLSELHFKAKRCAEINSTCGVFAISEMISQLVRGYRIEEVINGLHNAFASRIKALLPVDAKNIVVIGGVAKNKGIITALSKLHKANFQVPAEPQIVSAIGAVKYYTEVLQAVG